MSPFQHRAGPHRKTSARIAIATGITLVASFLAIGQGQAASAADPLISQNKPATASSVENVAGTPAYAADDGDLSSRWASAQSDPQ